MTIERIEADMKGLNSQSAFKIRTPEFSRRVNSIFKKGRGTPIVQNEYIYPADQGRFSKISELENCVSLLQTASINIERVRNWLQEMKTFLEDQGYRSFQAQVPVSVINGFLTDRLMQIKAVSESASFQGRAIFNGDCGIGAEVMGRKLKFVRGSARVESSSTAGYSIAVYQPPEPSVLMGSDTLSKENLKKESMIVLADDQQEVRYRIDEHEDPDSLVKNLQRCLRTYGFDINVYVTQDDRLYFRHNQLGTSTGFKGSSYLTRIISDSPGEYQEAKLGKNIEGTIGTEEAHGNGGFLIGNEGNPRTDGLIVFFDGVVDFPGQIVGHVNVQQNGIKVPINSSADEVEILSIPSIQPELLSVGVPNESGFEDLSAIRANTVFECRDALKLIVWSISDLEYLQEDLKIDEDKYVDKAVELLRSTMSTRAAGEEIFNFSKTKAKDMVEQLRSMMPAPNDQ